MIILRRHCFERGKLILSMHIYWNWVYPDVSFSIKGSDLHNMVHETHLFSQDFTSYHKQYNEPDVINASLMASESYCADHKTYSIGASIFIYIFQIFKAWSRQNIFHFTYLRFACVYDNCMSFTLVPSFQFWFCF